MGAASYQITSFAGGAWSKIAQGRVDRPDYKTALNVCENAVVYEQGAWAPRPGFRYAMHSRGGVSGRVIGFDFKQAAPYLIELTSGFMRFFQGPAPVLTTEQAVVAISTANPAVVQVAAAPATGAVVMFSDLATANPLLQNRQFLTTNVDGTHFSLQDALTGAGIDGSTLGVFASGNVWTVYEIATPYNGTLWSDLRAIPADIPTTNSTTSGAVLLHPTVKPYVLQVVTAPTESTSATFSLGAAVLKDGPYFDPVPGGTLATPSGLVGNITITLAFNAYAATTSYSVGDYVSSGGVNYKSLTDANLNNAPPNATYWVAVSAADAIGPNGFTGSDVGRHIRLFSEPAIWDVAASYAAGSVVAYGGTGNQYTGATYWKSLVGTNVGNVPGIDLTKWALFSNGAKWTWGRITGLSNIIDRGLAGSASIGDMTGGGGLAAAFDGISTQVGAACAEKSSGLIPVISPGAPPPYGSITITSYVGKNYSGASDQKIAQAVVYPSSDRGFSVNSTVSHQTITLKLRAKASLPGSSSDGTLLGSVALTTDTSAAQTITSNDQSTAWKYVWVEMIVATTFDGDGEDVTLYNAIAELVFVSPAGTGTGQGCTVQIVGDALLYTTPIRTWRLGIYSDTTGWPSCGTYHEGRLWLSGSIANRIDSSKSNDIFNFAPTNADGSVSPNNAISYTFNAPDINPIFFMVPDYLGIICGTQAGEWLVQATTQNLALTPTTIQAHRVTTNQCANIEPRRTDLSLAVVQAYKRELLEYFADVYSGKFSAQDLAWAAKHFTKSGILEIAYQAETVSTLWARTGDGDLIGCTYKRDSLVSSQEAKVKGWHHHTLGSGRTIESIAMTATADGTLPTLAMMTVDPATNIRHVEMLTKFIEETDDLADAFLLDDAVNPTSVSSSIVPIGSTDPYGGLTLYGLWHLNGKTVQVFAGGLDCGNPGEGRAISDFIVSNGSVYVPYGDSVGAGSGAGKFDAAFAAALETSQIVVGFTYNSDGQAVRPVLPADTGARSGPGFAKTKRSQRYGLQVVSASGLEIGTDFDKMKPVLFKDVRGRAQSVLTTFTGIYRDTLNDDYSYDSMICWRISRPLPAIIASLGAFDHTQDI